VQGPGAGQWGVAIVRAGQRGVTIVREGSGAGQCGVTIGIRGWAVWSYYRDQGLGSVELL
jgi:hypothetical protein